MAGIIVAVVVIVLSVAIIFAYLTQGTKLDRINRKNKKQELKSQPKSEEVKTKSNEENKEENSKKEVKHDTKQASGKDSEQKVDLEQIKKEMYDKAVQDLTPTIQKEVEEKFSRKQENEKNNMSVGEQIQNLSPGNESDFIH